MYIELLLFLFAVKKKYQIYIYHVLKKYMFTFYSLLRPEVMHLYTYLTTCDTFFRHVCWV